ncbi:MAG TPA: DUF3006 domain-containing protein [Firmicutes bacterium]|nr:DUF3006 domain-containing protein [Candidatus Fermentithermobacillaceae bacterium]
MTIIDRFEGDWAVIEWENGLTFNFPRALLPPGAKSGDVVEFNVSIDRSGTEMRRIRIKRLEDDLFRP